MSFPSGRIRSGRERRSESEGLDGRGRNHERFAQIGSVRVERSGYPSSSIPSAGRRVAVSSESMIMYALGGSQYKESVSLAPISSVPMAIGVHIMRALVALTAVIAVTFILSRAIGANAPDRPPGVAATQWAPISESLGVVMAPEQQRKPIAVSPNALLLMPPAEGYFMVKQGNTWRRLILVEPVKGPGPAG